MKETVNVAIQILPVTSGDRAYKIIDKAIQKIQDSGIKHIVCPFETVLEGTYDEIMRVISELYEPCYMAGANELIINLKIHMKNKENVTIERKMEKYR